MNPEMKTTLGLAGTAAALLVLVLATGLRPKESDVFTAQGKPYFAEFVDPLKATALEILELDEATASAKPFRVAFDNGKWTIPSHHGYPADAKDRLAKTAASVIDLKKDQIASTTEKDWESLGVVDPLEVKGAPKGTGRRVKFYSGTQAVADFIFGKDAGEGKKYVRVPGDKRTYVSKTPGEISSKFEDWVETDLLDVSGSAIRRIVIDKYSLDETTGELKDRSVNTLAREDSAKPWTLNELKDVEEVHADNVSAMTAALDDLKIAGVRPKPPLIAKAKDLTNLGALSGPQLQVLAQELGSRGYFVVYTDRAKKSFGVLCNEGEMTASCEDGVVYQLRFGEVLFGSGDEVTAGGAAAPKKDEKKDEKKGGTENRYLIVSTRFDESLLGAPPLEPTPYVADPSKKPEEQKAAEEAAKKAKEDWESKKKERESKIEAGKKRADKLANRFAEWYYVITAESFKKLRLDRPGLVKPKEKKPDEKKDDGHKHDDKDGHKHDEKGAPKKPDEKKPEAPKGEAAKPEEKKPEAPKPAEPPKADAPKPEEKKPVESPKSQEPSPKPDAPKPVEPPKPAETPKVEEKKP